MLSYSPSLKVKAEAEIELRRRRRTRQVALRALPIDEFAARTKIEVPIGANETALVPFTFWPAQHEVAATMERERLIVILKARQLGISWLVCLFALRLCTLWPGQPVLALSRGQMEADELVHRISVMHREHSDRVQVLPRLTKDNTADLEWDNGSTVVSLAATKDAGRGFTGSLVILDEWAFMKWPRATLAAVKPTIDAGGRLIIISSADGKGSAYNQFWNAAKAGQNGYVSIFLPWSTRPERGHGWRDEKIREAAGDRSEVVREYPENDIEAFSAAAGQVYDVWSDGPETGNVTEAADYTPDGGPVYWAVDDGYEGAIDVTTGQYTARSSPRVFLLVQEKADGHLDVFNESYRVKLLSDSHITLVREMGYIDADGGNLARYPDPDYAAVDSAAAELRGRLTVGGLYTRGKPNSIDESIKATRRMLAPDENGWRRIRVHPRCKHLRFEMGAYRKNDKGEPIDEHNHGPDALRYLAWTKRLEA